MDDFCRNTVQSNGWSYYDNTTYQDKNVNGCNFWRPHSNFNFNFNDRQRHCSKSQQRSPYYELDDHMKQASADYRIRITVNSDAAAAAATPSHRTNISNKNSHSSSSSSSASIEESESNDSAASVTIIEVDDGPSVLLHQDHHSNDNGTIDNTHIEQQHYNEKAIDVPAEFERNAYAYQRNELSPFVRNLQLNSQVG